ncbi:DUF6233 domain-containing protein [Streptomyces zaomyceticus]|uniref:DUF6233 domain-containing protein n=1 Tax=Streptomyces zaomyceticus TaxID=68286 RepID=UPI003789AA15
MHEELSSPELEKLQLLHRVQLRQLEQTERWIGTELARLHERAARRPLPDGPTLVVSYLREGGQPVMDSVHLGDCRMASKHVRPLTDEQARRALAVDGIRACEICRPDAELGILD